MPKGGTAGWACTVPAWSGVQAQVRPERCAPAGVCPAGVCPAEPLGAALPEDVTAFAGPGRGAVVATVTVPSGLCGSSPACF